MKRKPALEAMNRNQRMELFAKVAKLPTQDAALALRSAFDHLGRFNGRVMPRSALYELLRVSGATRPIDLAEAMTRCGFLDPSIERGRFAIDLAPVSLCRVQPPVSPATAEKKLRTALAALFAAACARLGDA